ncbi:MAG: hypothetical protein HY674_08380 [Chloroflexi bacterium]|nr:hypothetical protein [Chloroflexota bacterium]
MNQPTTFELAQIAAALANGQPLNPLTAPLLAKQALCLWEACNDSLDGKPKGMAAVQAAFKKQHDAIAAAAPKPSKYPVPLDEVLRLTVGGQYRGDRLRTYRKFLRESGIIQPPPDQSQVADILARQRRFGISEQDYAQLCHEVMQWLRQDRRATAQKNARQAARKRWPQERRKLALAKKLKDSA